jgi:6,7-dimethyl-8-ribityllumazine synthase
MSSADKNLSVTGSIPDAASMRIAIVVSSWNQEITESLYNAAFDTLVDAGCYEQDIMRHDVPGSYELPLGAKWALDTLTPDAVICLGCVIQGETRHFDFICQAVSYGIMSLNLEYAVPIIFGVLTTENLEQARERAGGKHGNKGVEAAASAVQMIALGRDL